MADLVKVEWGGIEFWAVVSSLYLPGPTRVVYSIRKGYGGPGDRCCFILDYVDAGPGLFGKERIGVHEIMMRVARRYNLPVIHIGGLSFLCVFDLEDRDAAVYVDLDDLREKLRERVPWPGDMLAVKLVDTRGHRALDEDVGKGLVTAVLHWGVGGPGDPMEKYIMPMPHPKSSWNLEHPALADAYKYLWLDQKSRESAAELRATRGVWPWQVEP